MLRIFKISEDIPLMGTVYFGIIDRGTNVLQIRPSTSCPLNCIFCSTDAGPKSKNRQTEYIVDLDILIKWIREIVKIKGMGIEAHIDTVGDPLTYPWLIDLIQNLKELREISIISIQTHGYLLNERTIEELEAAGLSRINLSIDALDEDLAKKLSGSDYYNIKRIMEIAEYITKNTSMDLLIAPVWVHPLNDKEIEKIIDFAKKIGAGKKWPALGIQKCEFHKFGRRTKEIKYMTWYEFYNRLRELEIKTKMKLILKPSDFGIEPRKRIKNEFKKGEKIKVKVIGPGWFKGESLAITQNGKWCLTIIGEVEEDNVIVRLVRVKDNILIGIPI
ncbi:MAG: radical SAM protein [Candidatus Methanomethylicaceae archaeon]